MQLILTLTDEELTRLQLLSDKVGRSLKKKMGLSDTLKHFIRTAYTEADYKHPPLISKKEEKKP